MSEIKIVRNFLQVMYDNTVQSQIIFFTTYAESLTYKNNMQWHAEMDTYRANFVASGQSRINYRKRMMNYRKRNGCWR